MVEKIFYTRHDGGLTLFKSGKHSTVSSTHPNFSRILDALRSHRFGEVEDLMNIGSTITKLGVSRKFKDRKVFVEAGEVKWVDSKGVTRTLAGPLVDRILDVVGTKEGNKFADGLLMFMDNMKKNTLKDIRAEIYDWLMSGKAPITYDGCFLAYKKIRSDYKDIHSGTMDNSPGTVVRMAQEKVDRDRTNECSVGLHFCSREYLSHYSGSSNDRVMIVKVNPRHVFAIPKDYSCQKGRASEYFVVGEYSGDWKNDEAFKSAFVDEDSKFTSMPEVQFASGWLHPSVEKLGESFGIVKEGTVLIIERRGIKVPVKPATRVGKGLLGRSLNDDEKGDYVDLMGTPVNGDPTCMSFATKSVREAVKFAIRKADKSYKA